MNRALIVLLLFAALFVSSCGKAADPKAREKQRSYLRCVMPESLLEFAHVEVPAIENIAIMMISQSQSRRCNETSAVLPHRLRRSLRKNPRHDLATTLN